MTIQHICGLCASNRNKLCYYKWNFPIVKCLECGFVETVVQDDLDLSSIYSEEYYDGGKKDGYVDYKASQAILEKEFEELLVYLEKFITNHSVLVELGSAYGFLLKMAKSRFKRVVGFEISEPSIEYCLQQGLEVYPVSDLQKELPSIAPVDVLVMLDTIEHVEKPLELLESLFKSMNKGGIIVLTTGDIGSLYGKITGKNWRLMTPPQHLSFFSVDTLSKMLKKAGFEIVVAEKPWKKVPLKLVIYQIISRLGFKNTSFVQKLPNLGVPVNLFDAMRIIAKRPI
jgi:2-polyprenyl-3-methyl-5-hydroxy-6-metoxy-1,4-benzoquinol methylase